MNSQRSFHPWLILLFLSFFFKTQAQDCACQVKDVHQNSVDPCTLSIGQEIIVSTVAEFKQGISQINANGGNMTMLIEDGIYQVASTASFPYITASNVVIRSLSGNRDAVIIRGGGMMNTSSTEDGFLIAGNNVTIADLTIREVGNHGIQVSGHHLFIHNVRIQNTFEQMLKGSTSAERIDSAIVQCSLFEYPDGIGPQWYIGGLDIHKGQGWLVRDNVFKNISSPSQAVAEHAIHFWNNSADNIIERNHIINCDRGVGFGLGSSANTGGIIRNNMIYNDGSKPYHDVGIGLETSPGTTVFNNTIFIAYQNAIEYRFQETTDVEIANNLTNKLIRSRNGGTANKHHNFDDAEAIWFQNADSGNLYLAQDQVEIIAQGANLSHHFQDDIDQNPRPPNLNYDIGAHEFKFAVNTEQLGKESTFQLYPNPANHQLTISKEGSLKGQLKIWDNMGLLTGELTIENQESIDLTDFENGMYFYEFTDLYGHRGTGQFIVYK